ncbi:hypothetical protein FPV67DRAFT_1775019 [Lyophyllum atratum]|nr:hypothetical protein FPV67DRAFT_1775019 [Lyophyllum atratum]
MHLHFRFFLPLFLFYFWRAEAGAVNRTIDDTTGDAVTGARPIYLPATPGVWENAACTGCAVKPDPAQAFKGSWTAATYNKDLASMSIELSFTGTAIYVFFILANFVADGVTTETACNFTLDGRAAGSFNHVPSTSTALEYNALSFSQTSLKNVDHKLVISTSGITDRNIFVNFDYAIYTFDDTPTPTPTPLPTSTPTTTPNTTSTSATSSSSPGTPTTSQSTTRTQESQTSTSTSDNSNGSSSSKLNIGAIAGGVAGGVVAILALILLFICFRRRRRSPNPSHNGFSIDGESPMAPAFTGSQYRGAVTPYALDTTSSSARYRARPDTQSDFLQSGTIRSPYSPHPEMPSFYGALDQQNPMTSPSRTNSDMVDPSIPSSYSDAYGGMASDSSAYGGLATAASAAGPPLVHVRSGSTATQDSSREAVRRARQSEIDQRLRVVRREMHDLKTDITTETPRRESVRSTGRTRTDEAEISEMREQMRLMQEQIEFLRGQQQSEWAQGLSDEPPPGYADAAPSLLRAQN